MNLGWVSGKKSIKWYRVFDSKTEAEQKVPLYTAVTVLIEQQKICLSHFPQGFFAIDDACPHLGASLSKGTCNTYGEVVCPWHSYRFNSQTGEEKTGHNLQVKTYPVEWRNNALHIGVQK